MAPWIIRGDYNDRMAQTKRAGKAEFSLAPGPFRRRNGIQLTIAAFDHPELTRGEVVLLVTLRAVFGGVEVRVSRGRVGRDRLVLVFGNRHRGDFLFDVELGGFERNGRELAVVVDDQVLEVPGVVEH